MVLSVSILITIGIIFLGLYKHNSKIVTLLLLILLFVFLAFAISEEDYVVYVRTFYELGQYQTAEIYEPLYRISCRIANNLGLNFDGMRAIFSVAELMIFYIVTRRYTENSAFVFALLFIFPITIYAEQFRFLAGMTFIIWGLQYIIKAKSKIDYLKYLCCVICAAMFHATCWAFLIYYLLLVKNRRKLLEIILVIFIAGLIVIQNGSFYSLFSSFWESERLIDKYSETQSHNLVGTAFEIFRLGMVLSMSFIATRESLLKKRTSFCLSCDKKSAIDSNILFERIVDINLVSFLFIIPLFFSGISFRLLQPLLLYNYIAFAIAINRTKGFKKEYAAGITVFMLLFILEFGGEGIRYAFTTHFAEGYMVNMFNVFDILF